MSPLRIVSDTSERSGIAIAAFTARGYALAEHLALLLGERQPGGKTASSASATDAPRDFSAAEDIHLSPAIQCYSFGISCIRDREEPLQEWIRREFQIRQALIFIGAAGIAVRTVAPYIQSKSTDPAVLVMDEDAEFVIPLLSGHLGGANALAQQIAALLGGTAVITTATDRNRVFAVDLWAKKQNLFILQPERIRAVSAGLLSRKKVRFCSPWPISGSVPQGISLCESAETASVLLTLRPEGGGALQLVPRCLTLGVGCRRGIGAEQIDRVFREFCLERSVLPQAVSAIASIDRKRNEKGLLEFCRMRNLPSVFFSAEELQSVRGCLSSSEFVRQTVGVDNVCERSAVLASGGHLFEVKYAREGVSFALAINEPVLSWEQ